MANPRTTLLKKHPELKTAYEVADYLQDTKRYNVYHYSSVLRREIPTFERIIISTEASLESYISYYEKEQKEWFSKKEVLENEKNQARHSITMLNTKINQLYTQVGEKNRLAGVVEQQKNKIMELEARLAQQSNKNSELDLQLLSYEKKSDDLKKEISELKNLNTSTVKELEDKLQIEKNSSAAQLKNFEFKEKNYEDKLEQAKVKLDHLENEVFDLSKELTETLIQLEEKGKATKSLDIQLRETKELNQEILMQLVDPSQNIEGLSLIRWLEKDELNNIKEDLIERGAILTVSDLLLQIQKIKPPHNETHKVELLNYAVEKLMLDYEEHLQVISVRPQEKILPSSAIDSLMEEITPEIEKDLKAENPEWLRDLYLTQIDLIKNTLFDKYFSKEANGIPYLDEQFNQAKEWIKKSERHKHYHKLLNDQDLLNRIRNEDKDPTINLLVKLIKSKMDVSQMEITEAHHQKALQTILQNPTEEMN